jgi:hypothetical protein
MHLSRFSAGVAFLAIAAGTMMVTLPRGIEAANDNNPTQDEKLKILIGQQIVPVNLKLAGKNPDSVYLGSYLVNAIGCSDCHTNPQYVGNPFAGDPIQINAAAYLGGGRSFGPGVISRNITPDAAGQPAGMSFFKFTQAMRNGVDFDNIHPVLQVMPWPRFRYLTDRDMQAVYDYLSTIPCLEGDPGVSTSPTHRCAQ